ncbi:hypothetical protein ALP45_03916 [Pseudomonas coronafaciens pv. atropurpurea]|uniref:hypothetical protein n=1 Tax=Pseudomonas coronafaciens TaxID=53409 RepID=UPI0006D62C34|nr:hypothetical protein [Pseudomonas coronafaciens]KPW28769.1 hypothetical protein ALO66_01843 [Pseudomonas coronafaciens pv. atropurpurea]RMT53080.1 hypothetical protein ALP45_03916 [Pseudomonas coronafaciens pv. atropurpurea]
MEKQINIMMANHQDIISLVRIFLGDEKSSKQTTVPLYILKACISSPRLFDVYLRDFPGSSFLKVGDSYLDSLTMLGDLPQKTYGVSLADWSRIKSRYQDAGSFLPNDKSVSRVQIWPFDPKSLTPEQLKLAIAVSYSDLELYREPRLSGALRDLLVDYGIEPYSEPPTYG